ncbi:glycosyltransferase 87 family protein [uncultured Jatrophihabitans sp.]|uniref:glycosyltransferase 87 family protein n=1 Tax=uncultured Jatrophihabitans sp. TaxID=1610747 RepID=UPI0035C9C196
MAAARRVTATALGIVLAAQAVLFAWLLRYDSLSHVHHAQWLIEATAPLWVLAVLLLARLRPTRRTAGVVVLGAATVFSAIALTHPPTTSDDDYRYMWDAKVQLAGIDPYTHTAASPALARLRTPSLFGGPGDLAHCVHRFPGGCTSINRPTVHTIYPPVAQGAFDVLRLASFGGHGNHLPLQLAGALGSLALGWLLLRRRPAWAAALWSWSPVVVIEFANNAHIDWLAALFVVLALIARGPWRAGALVGAAIAVKLYPVLVLPSLMRRSWLAAVSAAGLVVLVYVPHLIAAGSAVIGYLPGYLQEEQYNSGQRLLLLRQVVPHPANTIVAVCIVAVAALWAWLRGPTEHVERSAVVVVGLALVVFTPTFGWYAGILLALVALSGAVEWLPIVLAPGLCYLVHTHHSVAIYLWATIITIAIAAVRHLDSLRSCLRSISPTTDPSRSSLSTPRR